MFQGFWFQMVLCRDVVAYGYYVTRGGWQARKQEARVDVQKAPHSGYIRELFVKYVPVDRQSTRTGLSEKYPSIHAPKST